MVGGGYGFPVPLFFASVASLCSLPTPFPCQSFRFDLVGRFFAGRGGRRFFPGVVLHFRILAVCVFVFFFILSIFRLGEDGAEGGEGGFETALLRFSLTSPVSPPVITGGGGGGVRGGVERGRRVGKGCGNGRDGMRSRGGGPFIAVAGSAGGVLTLRGWGLVVARCIFSFARHFCGHRFNASAATPPLLERLSQALSLYGAPLPSPGVLAVTTRLPLLCAWWQAARCSHLCVRCRKGWSLICPFVSASATGCMSSRVAPAMMTRLRGWSDLLSAEAW